ncbi:MAG: chemotaxis protein CheA [Thermodesulfobacteriota bacterium]
MPEIELDLELLADFIVESRELLEQFSANVLEMEKDPADTARVGAIFRVAHTLKGSSAFFNLIHIKNFAHKLENLLDELRNKTRQVTEEVVSLLLAGGNHLKAMFERLSAGDYSTTFQPNEARFLEDLLAFMEKKAAAAVLTPEETLQAIQALLYDFRKTGGQAEQLMSRIESLLRGLGPPAAKTEAPPTVVKKPTLAYYFQNQDLTEPVTRALTALDAAAGGAVFDDQAYDQALSQLEQIVADQALDRLREPLSVAIEDFKAVQDSGIGFDSILISLVREKTEAVIALMEKTSVESVQPPAPSPSAAASPPPTRPDKEEKHERKTMRIDEEKVDGFMNYVGELIVTAETFNYLQKIIEHEKVNPQTVRAFKNANQAFRELSNELQESLMEIRRVPIKGLMQKVNMMARELSHQMGKKIKVEIAGQEVQVDKSIAESLEGPLVHVVRNSLDHGLEGPEERTRSGKTPEGTLKVAAQADKEFFFLEVKDDGRGINPQTIKQAAVEKGLMSQVQSAALSDREAVNLIFAPGFSTAKEVTDVSGRGVGMDVVRNNVTQLNGQINVDSQVGLGTAITLKIPLSVTLQVVKALLVRVGRENFIISLDDILESLRPAPEDLSTIENRGEVIKRRGQIFPLIRLYEVFNIEPEYTDPAQAILVVVETSRGRFAFLVDEVLGQQQVVVRELDGQFKNLDFLAGSATLGDGRLGLVLETEGVIRLALNEG